MTRLNITQLAALVRCKPHTMRRRLDGLEPVQTTGRERIYDSADALSRYFTGESLDLSRERARLAREQADTQSMKNAQLRGDLIPAADVEAGYLAITSPIALKLDGLPSKAAPEVRAAGSDAEAETILRRHVDEARTEIADAGRMAGASGG